MASKHEALKWKVITDWSVSGRGRLYCMNQGMAYPMRKNEVGDNVPAEFPLWFGPLKRKFKGFPDTFGFEFGDAYIGSGTLPIYCVVEVKTKKDRLSKDQKAYLNYAVSIGARAYVAMEDDSKKGYNLTEWVVK